MIEQTPASSAGTMLAYVAGTIVLVSDIAAIAIAHRLASGISQGFLLLPAVVCLNAVLGLASLLCGARWLQKRLGAL